MAHADTILYNALKVITEDRTIRAYLEQHDPMALAQALDGIRTFDEENTPGREYVVDLYVPFSTMVPAGAAETLDDAAGLAQSLFASEQLYERMVEALDDTVWERSDRPWRTEVVDA